MAFTNKLISNAFLENNFFTNFLSKVEKKFYLLSWNE